MNLQLPLDEVVTAIAADDGAIARLLNDARLTSEAELLDALEHYRTQIGLSLAALDQLSGLAVGHSSKCLSPARTKSPTTRTLFAMLDSLALSVLFIIDPSKLDRVQPRWRRRAEAMVRQRAISATTIARARPHIVAELARRAARPRWANMAACDFMRAMVEEST
jgi:hypothetical protein